MAKMIIRKILFYRTAYGKIEIHLESRFMKIKFTCVFQLRIKVIYSHLRAEDLLNPFNKLNN
jgi:hypothetical protein